MNKEKIWDYFIKKLNNPYGVASLMGNLYVESKFNSAYLEGKYVRKFGISSLEYTEEVDKGTYSKEKFINDSAGYGLAQWTYWSRKESLYDYAKSVNKSIGDFDMQLDFMWDELQKYKTVINTLYSATSVKEASDIVAIRYEKPSNVTEPYLQNRANYGNKFLYEFVGGDFVNTAKQVDSLLSGWKSQGLKKQEIVVNLANACIGWSYVFGARGEYCNPANRRKYYNSHPDKETIKTKCKNFNGQSGNDGCGGCKWFPSGATRIYDCRGFTYWCFLNGASIKIDGAGATSQYNNDANWSEKGSIANMPRDKVCCVFRWDGKTMAHTLIYDGNGHYIHCSGEVKKCDMSKYNATHYAIPKGLYDGGEPVVVIGKAKVIASSGSTVNMRSKPSTSSNILAQVPIGTIVDYTEKGDTWCTIQYNGMSGYMMTKFLDFNVEPTPEPSPTPSGDTVTVKKSDLETIYAMVGAMLGK